jgi:hypothetical protein
MGIRQPVHWACSALRFTVAVAFIDGARRLAFRRAHFARRRRLDFGSECNCNQGSWLVRLASMDMSRDYFGRKPVFSASNGQLPSQHGRAYI